MKPWVSMARLIRSQRWPIFRRGVDRNIQPGYAVPSGRQSKTTSTYRSISCTSSVPNSCRCPLFGPAGDVVARPAPAAIPDCRPAAVRLTASSPIACRRFSTCRAVPSLRLDVLRKQFGEFLLQDRFECHDFGRLPARRRRVDRPIRLGGPADTLVLLSVLYRAVTYMARICFCRFRRSCNADRE